jgi:hypothetical protein
LFIIFEGFRRKGFFDIISENFFDLFRAISHNKIHNIKLYPSLKEGIKDLIVSEGKLELDNIDSDKIIGEGMVYYIYCFIIIIIHLFRVLFLYYSHY